MTNRQPNEEAIFHIARELSDDQKRAAYLDQVCLGDQGLRKRVQALLQTHEEQSFLKSNDAVAETADHASITEQPGQPIGRYKLLQKIGEGGFGVVYMAEQTEPVRRRVALKVIKPGMDSRAVIARFEAERQALAMMDHPNIARILDGGETNQGRPYFVMELVKGVPITEFCDANHLTTDQRLQLFQTVCRAVQHAHQKGIIHRDLKPSNILVTLNDGQPMPKVIDFGVAKALFHELTEKTCFTQFGQMIGTLQYMSPEQSEMSAMDVDTRSDVYSLGVVLHELLTGDTPISNERLRSSGYAEIQRLIKEEEPPRPSKHLSTLGEKLSVVASRRGTDEVSLQKKLRGDLDWIVLKSLMKERQNRYQSPTDLADEIDRYLRSDPIPRPATTFYYLRKLYERNRVLVVSSIFMVLSLIVGLAVAVGSFIYAADARDELRTNVLELKDTQKQLQANFSKLKEARDELEETVLELRAVLAEQAIDQAFQGDRELSEVAIARAESNGVSKDLTTALRGMADFFDGGQEGAIVLLENFVLEPGQDNQIALAALSWMYHHAGRHGKHEHAQLQLRSRVNESESESRQDEFFLILQQFVDGSLSDMEKLEQRITNLIVENRFWGAAYVLQARLRSEIAAETKSLEGFDTATKGIEEARRILGDCEFVMAAAANIYVNAFELANSLDDDRAAAWKAKASEYCIYFTSKKSENALGMMMAAIFYKRVERNDPKFDAIEMELDSLAEEGTISWIANENFELDKEKWAEWENAKDDPERQLSLCFALCLGQNPDEERARRIVYELIKRDLPSAFYAIATDIANLLGDEELLKDIIKEARKSGRIEDDYQWFKRYLDFHAGDQKEDMEALALPFAEDSAMYYYAVAMKAWAKAEQSGKVDDWKNVEEYLLKTTDTGTVTFWEYHNAKAMIDIVRKKMKNP